MIEVSAFWALDFGCGGLGGLGDMVVGRACGMG